MLRKNKRCKHCGLEIISFAMNVNDVVTEVRPFTTSLYFEGSAQTGDPNRNALKEHELNCFVKKGLVVRSDYCCFSNSSDEDLFIALQQLLGKEITPIF